MVEFAIVAGLLMTLIGGIVTYGVVLSHRQVMTQAATDGARAAAIATDNGGTLIDERVEAARTALDASLAAVDRSCPAGGDSDGLTCTIEIIPCPNDLATACVHILLVHDNSTHPLIPPVLPKRLNPDTISVETEAIVGGVVP